MVLREVPVVFLEVKVMGVRFMGALKTLLLGPSRALIRGQYTQQGTMTYIYIGGTIGWSLVTMTSGWFKIQH